MNNISAGPREEKVGCQGEAREQLLADLSHSFGMRSQRQLATFELRS